MLYLKLSKRYYGPYKVIKKIGEVAYKIDLTLQSKIHPVFHVSQLKQVLKRQEQVLSILPYTNQDG